MAVIQRGRRTEGENERGREVGEASVDEKLTGAEKREMQNSEK